MNKSELLQELKSYDSNYKEWELNSFHLISDFHKILLILLISILLKSIFILIYNLKNKLSGPFSIAFFILDLCILITILTIFLISLFNSHFRKLIIQKFFFTVFPDLDLQNYIESNIRGNNIQSPDEIMNIMKKWNVNIKKEIQFGSMFLIGLLILDYFQYLLFIQVFILKGS